MSLTHKLLGGPVIAVVVSIALTSVAQAGGDTPSAIGDIGKFEEAITMLANAGQG